jgi:hypothetical protein
MLAARIFRAVSFRARTIGTTVLTGEALPVEVLASYVNTVVNRSLSSRAW